MSDRDLRLAHRAVLATPEDSLARDRLLVARARHGEPVLKELAQALASVLLEVALFQDPWKMILTPCCGAEPSWSPTILSDFRRNQAASCRLYLPAGNPRGRPDPLNPVNAGWRNRCPGRGRQFLSIYFSPSLMDSSRMFVSREEWDRTPRFRGALHAETVRQIIQALPVFYAAGRTMVVHA